MHVVVLGDSIAQGLGVAGQGYADQIQRQIRRENPAARVTNLAASGAQISDSRRRLPEVAAWKPDAVIIAHGITEALLRPPAPALRLVPARWRQVGWLDPRPYFSRHPGRRLSQRVESAIRWRVKVALLRRFGGQRLTSPGAFARTLKECLETLTRETAARMVLLTAPEIDERFYPGSPASLRLYREITAEAAAQASAPERVRLCDASALLSPWEDFFADHFHPNVSGHEKLARRLYPEITR